MVESMRSVPPLVVAMVLVLVLVTSFQDPVSCQESGYAQSFGSLLKHLNNMEFTMRQIKGNNNRIERLQKFPKLLQNLQYHAFRFIKSPIVAFDGGVLKIIKDAVQHMVYSFQSQTQANVKALYLNDAIHTDFDTRTFRVLKKILKFNWSPSQSKKLPLGNMCADIETRRAGKISIDLVCANVNTCAQLARPYTNFGNDLTSTCKPGPKCHMGVALPFMTAMLWYKVQRMIVNKLCRDHITDEAKIKAHFLSIHCDDIKLEGDLMKKYSAIHPKLWANTWGTFFEDALSVGAYQDISTAIAMIDERKEEFEFAEEACYQLKFSPACKFSDILKQHLLFKKNKYITKIPGVAKVKDLRHMANMDKATMLQLLRDDIAQQELLATMNTLDARLQASFSGLADYFSELAHFDQGIAEADVTFLTGELNKYERTLGNVETKLKNDISKASHLMEVVLISSLATEVSKLALLVTENSNPLKLIFDSPDLAEAVEQTNNVASATTNLVKGEVLKESVIELAEDSAEFADAFTDNQRQISSLKKVVNQIKNNPKSIAEEDSERFVKEYGNYTPQTDRASLARNNALWSAFKDSICDVLSDDTGVAGTVAQGLAGAQLLCERLEGTLAQFFTLREDIFDFQFQLVDAVAAVVRSNVAQKLAQKIKANGALLDESDLLIGLFRIHTRIQTVSSLQCDIIEYNQLGKTLAAACSPVEGIFQKSDIDKLIAYDEDSISYTVVKRLAYIPTRSRFHGDSGYIDLEALAAGEEVFFRFPLDNQLLEDLRWLVPGLGRVSIPYVQEFKLFLPRKTYSAMEFTTTVVTITPVGSTAVSTAAPNTGVVYILPKNHSVYHTVYEEGYPSCVAVEMANPFSLCGNLPSVCDTTTTYAPDSLLPTILSTWSVRTPGGWTVPHYATNLLLRAQVKLKILGNVVDKRSHLEKVGERRAVEDGCCESNAYRNSWRNLHCEPCPSRTNSAHGGLYCEINDDDAPAPGRSKV